MSDGLKKVVLKFGGASNATLDHFPRICEIIKQYLRDFDRVVVVISAMRGITDQLKTMAHKISQNPKLRELDMLISIGERMSMTLLSIALNDRGIDAISLTGSQTGIMTTNAHNDALILDIKPKRLQEHLHSGKVVIVAGFQGVSSKKEVTTLGRGGSDTTAVALAIALDAQSVHFYKDVDGIYNQDPKENSKAKHFSHLTYGDALKIVETGAQILHKRSLILAKDNAIPLCVFSYEKEKSLHTQIDEATSSKPVQPLYEKESSDLSLLS